MLKNIPENIRQILMAILPLLGVIILFIFTASFGFGKISEARQKLSVAGHDQTVLNQKLNLLKTVSATVQQGADIASTALPGGNTSLIVSSQLKNLAIVNAVFISGIKSGPEVLDPIGLSRADISFDITGGRDGVVNFLKSISTIAPITVLDKVKLNETGGELHGSVTVKSFWKEFPTSLPPVNSAINDLTSDERQTLLNLANLTQPTFTEVPPSEGVGKANPFSQ